MEIYMETYLVTLATNKNVLAYDTDMYSGCDYIEVEVIGDIKRFIVSLDVPLSEQLDEICLNNGTDDVLCKIDKIFNPDGYDGSVTYHIN